MKSNLEKNTWTIKNILGSKSNQVAFTVNDEKTLRREISAFKRINDNYPKYLLTLDYDNANIDGIQKLNVIDWLLQ